MNYKKYYLSYIVLLNKCIHYSCKPRVLDKSIDTRYRFYQQENADNLIYNVYECCCDRGSCTTTMCPIKNMFKWLEGVY